MEASPARVRLARFGLFEADLEQLVLSKGGLRVRLQDQPFQILAMLLERPGELVTREEMGQKLWSADTFVEFDDGLNTAIRKLRHALGDEADNPRFIETVPRRGYRFIAPVSNLSPSPMSISVITHVAEPGIAPPPAIPAPVPHHKPPLFDGRHRRLAVALFALLLFCAIGTGIAAWRWSRPSPVPHTVRITQLTRSGAVHPNQNLATDGLRLFYIERENGDWVLKSMPATGGIGTRMDIPMPRYDLQDISPDASEMLLRRITTDADNDSIWIMPSVGGPAHRVGDVHILGAAYTADGRFITYSDDRESGTVYLCDKDGRNVRKLFSANGDVLRLRWSPHGDILRFTLNDPSGTSNTLWEVHADGSGMHQLLPGWNLPKWEWMMGWSRDARWFAFSAARQGGKDIWLLEHDPASRNSDRRPVQLTAGPIEFDLPIFSTDNSRIYAVGVYRHGELLRFDPATRQFTPYLRGISADQLDFSRDRKWVAYVTYPDGVLWRAHPDGSEPLKLTETPMRVLAPKWSPDGERLSFLARTARGEKWQAFTVSAHGGLYQRIASGAEETTAAAWFDNGKTLVLSSPEWKELHTLDVATGKLGILPGSIHLQGALTSPRGRYLIGSREDGTSFEILDTKTSQRKLVAEDADYPSWSPDERYVYFNRFRGSKPAFYRLRLSDMKVTTVFDLKTFQAAGSWSIWSGTTPDGSFLLMRDLGGADVYAIDWESR